MSDPFGGQLCYGFLLDSQGEDIRQDEADIIEDFYGVVQRLYNSELGRMPSLKFNKTQWDKYFAKLRDGQEAAGVALVLTHLVYDSPQHYILAASNSCHTGTGCNPKELKPEDLIIKPEWREKLKSFCEKAGIKFKEPKWILSGYVS